MNKIKVFAIVALSALSVMSCRDAIDIVQDGEITKDVAIQNVSDLRSFLLGNVYNAINTNNEIAFTSYFTDETAIVSSNTGFYVTTFRYQLFADDSYASSIWLSHYNTIDKANRLINLASSITPSASQQAEYNSILAEARAIRAYAYLQLQSFFSEDMTKDDVLGVMLSTEVQPIDANLPRVKNAEIFKLIEDDLNFAEQNLDSSPDNKYNNYKYITKAAVLSLKARMYAYRGKEYASKVIDTATEALRYAPELATASGTSLQKLDTTPYYKMWTDAIQGEVIFTLSRPQVGSWSNIAGLWTTNTTKLDGAVQMGMSFKLFDLYGATDIRKQSDVFVDDSSDDKTKVINKYPGKGTQALRNDIKVIRTSELYFLLAEAYIHNGQLSLAAEQLKKVREARLIGNATAGAHSYTSQEEAYADLLQERRLELCFEGHRYVDLRRLGKLAGVSIDRSEKDDSVLSSTPLTLPITDHRFTLPIPQDEILGNPQLAKQQNTGY